LTEAIKGYWDRFWTERAYPGSQNDLIFQHLSLEMILRWIEPGSEILSVGCGDGFGFSRYCEIAKRVVGLDYSEEAIRSATRNCQDLIRTGRLILIVGDVLKRDAALIEQFDVAISERCLCNLASREDQEKAIHLIKDYVRVGGRAILCEPSLQGYDWMDRVRERLCLSKLKRHWHNLPLDEGLVSEAESFRIESRYSFGVYSLISRVFHPLYVHPEEPQFSSRINEIAAQICKKLMMEEECLTIPGQHVLYVLRRVK